MILPVPVSPVSRKGSLLAANLLMMIWVFLAVFDSQTVSESWRANLLRRIWPGFFSLNRMMSSTPPEASAVGLWLQAVSA
jgi:hypothetical protein